METKICIKCNIDKNIESYYTGMNKCKECKSLYRKEQSKKKVLENSTLLTRICKKCEVEKCSSLFNKHGARCKECEYSYYYENFDKIAERKRKYVEEHKDERKEYWDKYYIENKDEISNKSKERYCPEKKREYRNKNRESINKNKRERYNERRRTDDVFNLKTSLRSMIKNTFILKGLKKNNRTEIIIGCSVNEFKEYLESKFEDWMTWENKGLYNGELNYGWDIDHIIPIATAETEEDLIKLNHYTNLQPLCSYTNRYIKKDKYERN